MVNHTTIIITQLFPLRLCIKTKNLNSLGQLYAPWSSHPYYTPLEVTSGNNKFI